MCVCVCVCVCNHFASLSLQSSFGIKEGIKGTIVFRGENNDNISKVRKARIITYEQNMLIILEGI